MAVIITDGIALITSQGDWDDCEATPPEAVDITTSPGNLLLAEGYNEAVIVSPIFEFDPWTRWMFLSIGGTRAPRTAYFIRFRTAITEENISSAVWSDYLDSIQPDGSIGVNLRSWCKNNTDWLVGPFLQWELSLER